MPVATTSSVCWVKPAGSDAIAGEMPLASWPPAAQPVLATMKCEAGERMTVFFAESKVTSMYLIVATIK